MIIEQLEVGNKYQNFNYLVACPESGNAVVVDPLDHKLCLNAAKNNGWTITHVINTHEHFDHVGGNSKIVAATNAQLLTHANIADSVPNVDSKLEHGDTLDIGPSGSIEVLFTHEHTMGHICLLVHGDAQAPVTGDTVFNAGVGNCKNGGDVRALYQTLTQVIGSLPDQLQVFPGHDYMANNLRFTLDREPGNVAAKSLLEQKQAKNTGEHIITSLGTERKINVLLRLDSEEVIDGLKDVFPDLPQNPDQQTVFTKLRELRDAW